MSKRPREEEVHENEDRWLLTYADLITLLMAFFVIMYALSKVDAEKFQQLAVSLSSSFHTAAISPIALPGAGVGGGIYQTKENEGHDAPREPTPLQKLGTQLQEMVNQEGMQDQVTITANASGHKLTLRLADSLLFDPGSAVLTPQAEALISNIADIIIRAGKQVRVEGHTDNVPIHNMRFQSNWELSTARATSVILYLINRHQLPPEMLSASGYGEYRPLLSNDTPENRAKNRRVEFVITDEEQTE